ncbi:PrgI family protein [uncultured Clostridium sp.]|uniref:PrgI family protein n=1 Tax=uncultured Clostridium sp. TaxID=59620 RepID=UPI00258FD76C|nr:PrgI family protein [uncultured Clostridium sp.]
MIEIRINRDPREYKDKIIAGLTLRQLICTVIMLGINIPLYIFGAKYINKELIGYLIILIAVPFILIGFFEYNKMPFERVIWAAIQSKLIQPSKRKYSNKNVIAIIDEYIIKEELLNIKNSKAKKNKRKSK